MLVQTLDPSASCLGHAAAHDAPGFLARELERRKLLRYPPFAGLVRVMASAFEQADADRATNAIASQLGLDAGELLGPAPLFKVKDRHRSVLLAKTDPRALAAVVARIGDAVARVAADREHKGVKLSVDVDPQ